MLSFTIAVRCDFLNIVQRCTVMSQNEKKLLCINSLRSIPSCLLKLRKYLTNHKLRLFATYAASELHHRCATREIKSTRALVLSHSWHSVFSCDYCRLICVVRIHVLLRVFLKQLRRPQRAYASINRVHLLLIARSDSLFSFMRTFQITIAISICLIHNVRATIGGVQR